MTEKPAKPEKKRKIWRGHALYFPFPAIAIACGAGLIAFYAHSYFINNPILEIFFYIVFWYFPLCVSLAYMLYYLMEGKHKRNGWDIGKCALLCVTLFLGILGIADSYGAKLLIGQMRPISLEAWLGGILAVWGLFFFDLRTKNEKRQLGIQSEGLKFQARGLEIQAKELESKREELDIKINEQIESRFDMAVSSLRGSGDSASAGIILSLYELAMDNYRFRAKVARTLCLYICSRTGEKKYQEQHKDMPSKDIQTAIDLLFKDKGLYRQKFAQEEGFPRANLSHAYLHGANFASAQCQQADFSHAQCQKANFNFAQCQRAVFRSAQLYMADFMDARCQRANFSFAKCYSATFANAHCQKANFTSAQCAGASFFFAKCYGARFESAQCQSAGFSHAECQGAYFGEAQCQFANFRSVKCQGANFDLTAFQSASFNEKTNFCGAYSHDTSVPLEDRINKTTKVVTAIFAGELSPGSVHAIEEARPYATERWYQKMQQLISESEGKPENNRLRGEIITGVLKDGKEIREIAAEISKWKR